MIVYDGDFRYYYFEGTFKVSINYYFDLIWNKYDLEIF
jgi:hypothetical protein